MNRAYIPASSAMSFCWPQAIKIGLVFAQITARGMLTTKRTNMALCMCIPIIWYCLAPYDCPQNVSSALAIPNYRNKNSKDNKQSKAGILYNKTIPIEAQKKVDDIILRIILVRENWL